MNETIKMIKTSMLMPHPKNPRKDLGDLTELADSIEKNGVLQNLTVVPGADGYYTIIGHRRAAAAKEAGVEEVPCRIVEGMSEAEQVAVMLEENMQRADLTIAEQAQGFQMMLDLGIPKKEIEKKTGFSRSTIDRRLELAKLKPELLTAAVEEYQLTFSDLEELNKLKDPEARNRVLDGATSKWQIVNGVSKELEKEEEKKIEKKIKKATEGLDVKKGSGKTAYQSWGNRCKEIMTVEKNKIPAKIEDLPDEPVYWYKTYGDRVIFYTVRDEEEQEEDRRQQQDDVERRNRKRLKIEAVQEEIRQDLIKFAIGIIDGTLPFDKKSELDVWKKAWPVIHSSLQDYTNPDFEDALKEAGTDLKEDEIEPVFQMLLTLAEGFGKLAFTGWAAVADEEDLKEANVIIAIFKDLGFSLESEEQEKVMAGDEEYHETEGSR